MTFFKDSSVGHLSAAIGHFFNVTVPLLVVSITIDKHHTPSSLKVEQLIVAVASLLVISQARDFFEQRFEKILLKQKTQSNLHH